MQFAPVDGLPAELLSLIFVTLQNDSLYAQSIGDDSYGWLRYPALLSSVCSRWRHIAIATPFLWSYLEPAVASQSLLNPSHLSRSLERAKNYPLRIRIGKDGHECAAKTVHPDLATMLMSSAPQLDSLALSYWHSSFAKEVISTLFSQDSITPIRHLSLYAASGNRLMHAEHEVLPQEYLDQLLEPLQTLYLESVSLDWDFIPCRNLKELQLVELPGNGLPALSQLVDMLRANPGLRSLKLTRFHLAFTPPETEFAPIYLPNLQKLELEMHPGFIDWFLRLLVPGSQPLDVHMTSWSVPDHPDVTNAILSLSKRARIESLGISGDWLLPSGLYGSLPHLRALRLSSQRLFDSTFAGLREAVHLLPHLHTFDIMSCAHGGGIQHGLRIMYGLQSLRRIRFRHCSFYEDGKRLGSEEVVKWISSECASGKIDVSDSPELDFSIHPSQFR